MFGLELRRRRIWEFPKIRGNLVWGPYNKGPTIWVTILGSPIFGNSHLFNQVQGYAVAWNEMK